MLALKHSHHALRFGPLVIGTSLGSCVSISAFAAAQDSLRDLTLEYDTVSGCGSHSEVMGRVRDALGNAAEDLPAVHAKISVRHRDSSYVVWFRARKGDVESQRTLIVDGCAAATEASTLLLLLTLDPVLAESLGANHMVAHSDNTLLTPEIDSHDNPTQQTPAPSSPTSPEPPSVPPSLASPQPKAPIPDSSHAVPVSGHERWSIGAWGALGGATVSQITPALGLGIAIEGGVRVERLRLGIRGGWIQSMATALDEVAGASVSARMVRVHFTTAFELGPRSVRFGPALDLGLDHLTTEAEGVSVSRPGSTVLLSAAAGVWTNVAIAGNCGLAARLGALFPLERPRFQVVRLLHPVHQPGIVGLDGFVGLFYVWGSQS